jgi:hypothetical protein
MNHLQAVPLRKYVPSSGCLQLTKGRVLAMPVCLALENTGRLNDFGVIQCPANKLDAHRQTVLAKAARDANRRKPADVADSANGIGKGQRLIQVRVDLAGRHWQ